MVMTPLGKMPKQALETKEHDWKISSAEKTEVKGLNNELPHVIEGKKTEQAEKREAMTKRVYKVLGGGIGTCIGFASGFCIPTTLPVSIAAGVSGAVGGAAAGALAVWAAQRYLLPTL